MNDADRELSHEMNQPVFTNYDPERPWVIVGKDYDEGSRAMWREYERFPTQADARHALRVMRENRAAYEDKTGYESLVDYKIVEDPK